MNPGCLILIGIFTLPAAEILAFVAVAQAAGFAPALGLLIVTTLTGLLILALAGRRARSQIRAAGMRLTVTSLSLGTAGTLAALGGLLLFIPGFLTDLLGLWALAAALRRWTRGRATHTRSGDQIVDLERSQWRRVPDPALDTRRDDRPEP
jgi:UPF0716 family protein affecting phage T7 exclusion